MTSGTHLTPSGRSAHGFWQKFGPPGWKRAESKQPQPGGQMLASVLQPVRVQKPVEAPGIFAQ